ncbi:MAG TPA: hypothetical protein VEF89_16780 [Solirubrobacteraceae bacterium]|nr:hypothetical protein [Solirubrobacteraceae bacterium]
MSSSPTADGWHSERSTAATSPFGEIASGSSIPYELVPTPVAIVRRGPPGTAAATSDPPAVIP